MYKQSKAEYEREYGSNYERPHFGARIVAGIIEVIPKVGKLKSLQFIAPSPEAQALFRASFHQAILTYCRFLSAQTATVNQATKLPNTDFDTGHPTLLGEYSLADRTYGEWVRELAKNEFKDITAPVRQNILAFYADNSRSPSNIEEKEKDNLLKTQEALVRLRALKL